jgi:hypothetical protein
MTEKQVRLDTYTVTAEFFLTIPLHATDLPAEKCTELKKCMK